MVENRAERKGSGVIFIHIRPKGAFWIIIDESVVDYRARFGVQVVENRTGSQEDVVSLLPDDDIGLYGIALPDNDAP